MNVYDIVPQYSIPQTKRKSGVNIGDSVKELGGWNKQFSDVLTSLKMYHESAIRLREGWGK